MRRLLTVACGAILGLTCARADAAQGVKRVGIQAGFAGLANEGSFAGFGGALDAGYAINDALTIAALASASSNQVTDKGGRGQVFSQSIGLVYALDVLQIVPYAGLYAGLYELHGGGLPKTQLKAGAQLAVGLDWVYSRDFTFGLEIRAHALPGDFFAKPDNPTPFYMTTFLKAEYTWGWF